MMSPSATDLICFSHLRWNVQKLCELATADLGRAAAMPETLMRRVRHVVTENERVLATAQALRAADEPALAELFAASHTTGRLRRVVA